MLKQGNNFLLLFFQFDNMRGHVVACFSSSPTGPSDTQMNLIDRHLKQMGSMIKESIRVYFISPQSERSERRGLSIFAGILSEWRLSG